MPVVLKPRFPRDGQIVKWNVDSTGVATKQIVSWDRGRGRDQREIEREQKNKERERERQSKEQREGLKCQKTAIPEHTDPNPSRLPISGLSCVSIRISDTSTRCSSRMYLTKAMAEDKVRRLKGPPAFTPTMRWRGKGRAV